jgi:NarL family two-component system response regulator YdfI
VIRVLIVAASPLARAGLQNLLAHREVEVVGSTGDLESASGLLSDAEMSADAILVDGSGETVEAIAGWLGRFDFTEDIPVVVLEGNGALGSMAEFLRHGVRAVLPGGVSSAELVATLRAVTSGLIVLHPSAVGAMVPAAALASQRVEETAEALTKREKEVLQMLAAGLGTKEIAARLNISDHTAKFHVASILGKLGAGSRAEAVAVGIRRGLVLL